MMSEGSVSMNIDSNKEKESLNEDEAIQNKVLHGEQILLKDNVLKIETNTNNGNDVTTFGLQGQGVLQAQQQLKPRGKVVSWEKLLHVRSIQVLLVENDDSTRHVVSALLRNCNYEVVEAANGLQAWKLLEDLTNHIDIVLTEVVMPCVSGIVLLSKIMSHKTRKNIPVIMMSSHDSMGLVFECLSKGAADFLVKPVRKNELKNLWQHVWKRCHSSSGSGSESGTRTRKSVKSKSRDKFDNSGSYDGANNERSGLEDVSDGSEDGSDAQSTWMKQAVEVGRSKAMSPIDQLADCPDSTYAQDTCSNAEAAANKMLQNIIARKAHKGKEHDTIAKGKRFETVIPRNSESQSENPNESHRELHGAEQLSLLGINCNINNNRVDEKQFKTNGGCLFSIHKDVTANMSSPLIDCRVSECTREVANISEIYNNVTDKSKKPNKELSLKRFRGVQEIGRTVQDDRCVLRHSEQSTFSRYNTPSNVFKTPNGITGSSSVVDCSVESATRETTFDIQAHSIDHLLCRSSKGSSNNIDMGSTTKKLSTLQSIVKDKSEETPTINSSALRPVKNDLTYTQHKVNLVIHNDMQTTENLAVARGSNEDGLHPYHHHHRHRHHHCHCHNFPNLEQQPPLVHNELSLKKLTAYSPRSGSSNVFGEPMDANPRNYSLNGHASGSKHGSNGQNGSSTALEFNAESDPGQAGKNGSEDASGSGSNKRGENKLALQKDALNKICHKRKER